MRDIELLADVFRSLSDPKSLKLLLSLLDAGSKGLAAARAMPGASAQTRAATLRSMRLFVSTYTSGRRKSVRWRDGADDLASQLIGTAQALLDLEDAPQSSVMVVSLSLEDWLERIGVGSVETGDDGYISVDGGIRIGPSPVEGANQFLVIDTENHEAIMDIDQLSELLTSC